MDNTIVEMSNQIIVIPTNEELLEMFELRKVVEPYKGRFIAGLQIKQGRYAGQEKNMMLYIDNIYYVLCNKNTIFTMDDKSYSILQEFNHTQKKDINYSVMRNNYIIENVSNLYIHQIIMNYYGNGKGTLNLSIDHIDRNPLNNCYSNLRIVDRKTQEENSKGIMDGTKRARKKSACELPNGLTQEMLPKYVVYYKEQLKNGKFRDYFKIEKHPKSDKIIIGKKAMSISIFDKLELIKSQLNELEQQKE